MADLGIINGANPAFRQIALGDFTITTVLDGFVRREQPTTTFGTNQTPDAIAQLLVDNHLPTDCFVHCFVPTMVKTADDLILFDTGFGPMGRADGNGQLRNRMQSAGYAPEDVTIVVLTHMHGDHVGGLMEEDGPAFPNARYVSSKTEYDFWTSDARLDTPFEGNAKLVRKNVVPLANKFSFVSDGEEVVPGITAIAAPGHSPGHTVYRLESEGKALMLTADTANHYVLSLQKPDWYVVFDFDKDQAAETRKRIFGMIADEKIPFVGHHMPFPAIGFVERMGEGFRYIPASYQFDIK